MGIRNSYVVVFFLNFVCLLLEAKDDIDLQTIKRSDFPNGFGFGASSSTYQVKKFV